MAADAQTHKHPPHEVQSTFTFHLHVHIYTCAYHVVALWKMSTILCGGIYKMSTILCGGIYKVSKNYVVVSIK